MENFDGRARLFGTLKNRQRFGFINWFLPLYYILAQYPLVKSNVGTVIIIGIALLRCFTHPTLKVHKWLAAFIGYCTFVELVFNSTQNFSITTIDNIVMPVLFLLITFIFINDINEDNLFKAYSIIGLIVMAGMFYQSIGYYLFNKPAVPITILPVSSDQFYLWGYFQGLRPSSFFTEPQAYASYMLPLLFLALKRKSLLFAALISLSILLSTSSEGILITCTIWTVYALISNQGFVKKILIVVPMVGLAYLFFTSGIFQYSISKIQSIDPTNNVRISRGFDVYSTFNIWNKAFGIGAGNLLYYVDNNIRQFNWTSVYIAAGHEQMLGYYTGVSGTLITYGIGAGFLLIVMFYKMARYDDPKNLIFLAIFLASFFGQNMLFNSWFLFYCLFYLGVCDKNRNYRNYITKYL